jgi:hypothetical protein
MYRLLIIDEIGYLSPPTGEAPLFQVLRAWFELC